MHRTCVVLTGIILLLVSSLTQAVQRHALIIGNSNYEYARQLVNPRNDSLDMARTLEALFFKVTLVQDATKEQMDKAIDEYIGHLQKKGGIGLLFYAGHGVQLEGNNYLVPIDVNVSRNWDIKQQSYSVARMLNGIRSAKTQTNIVILDACRDNPFKNVSVAGRSVGNKKINDDEKRGVIYVPNLESGLVELDAPPNTLIAFSTAPGRVASDGEGRNSPYTAELVKAVQNTGLTIAEVFRQVREQVVNETDHKQIPWESSSLIKDFYFKPRVDIPMGFPY